MKKCVVGLLASWFILTDLFSYADIIYLEREIVVDWVSVEDRDIVYLKNGKQIKGKIIERDPEQVKIEVYNDVSNHQIVYLADSVVKVEVRSSKKKPNGLLKIRLWKLARGCLWSCVGCVGLIFLGGLAMAPGMSA